MIPSLHQIAVVIAMFLGGLAGSVIVPIVTYKEGVEIGEDVGELMAEETHEILMGSPKDDKDKPVIIVMNEKKSKKEKHDRN